MLAVCKFCGTLIIPDKDFENKEDAEHYGTMHCKCSDAIDYQREFEEKQKREKNIKRIEKATESVELFCRTKGFYFNEEMRTVIMKIAENVLDEYFDNASFKFGQIKLSISKNSKGVLIFKKNYSETNSEEVV